MALKGAFINADSAIKYFERAHQGSPILELNDKQHREVICEIDPVKEHPEFSVVLAAISRTPEHYHMNIDEEIEVLDGELSVRIDREQQKLKTGDRLFIPSVTRHRFNGSFTLVKITSRTGWVGRDHIYTQAR